MARLHADLAAFDRLIAPERPSAASRLEEMLGRELARKLVFGLTGGRRRPAEVAAA